MDNDQDKLLDHEYDGIQELDNNLPLWWLWTFFATIVFGFIYWLHFSFSGEGPTLQQELDVAMAKVEEQRSKAAEAPQGGGEMSEEQLVASGAKLFKMNCSSCHKVDGGGQIGPNLTDSFWIHGNSSEAIAEVIKKGVLSKGMPPWDAILRPNEVQAVVAFVKSIENTNVANGKEPQGDKVE